MDFKNPSEVEIEEINPSKLIDKMSKEYEDILDALNKIKMEVLDDEL